jgi:hypothetical protein
MGTLARLALALVLGSSAALFANRALTQDVLPDDELAAVVVKQSGEAYYATDHPCACPEGQWLTLRQAQRVCPARWSGPLLLHFGCFEGKTRRIQGQYARPLGDWPSESENRGSAS